MDWHEEYKSKLVSAEEAVRVVKSGDRVYLSYQDDPELLEKALFDRRNELKNVEIRASLVAFDPGWWEPGAEHPFSMVTEVFQGNAPRAMIDAHKCDFLPHGFGNQFKVDERPDERKDVDVFITIVSPPDRNGFCSFGRSLWFKKILALKAKKIIAQVDSNYPRTFGNNFIHVSKIDYLVEHSAPLWTDEEIEQTLAKVEDKERQEKLRQAIRWIAPADRVRLIPRLMRLRTDMLEKDKLPPVYTGVGPTEMQKRILENVTSLVHDGDTYQVGGGGSFVQIYLDDFLENKIDIGIHTEVAGRSLVKLIEGGVITGKYKTLHPGKVVLTAFSLANRDDRAYMNNNPIFELYDTNYVINIKTVAAHDNFVAINAAMTVDLTGQIASETILGGRLIRGPGGQPAMHMGAVLSKGGRAVTMLPSTALGGATSTIIPQLEEGVVVTVPRNFADYIVTEYGIARLMGKTLRERAEELIRIAHPDFRAELKKAAKKLFYP